jgi:hypothetical protein
LSKINPELKPQSGSRVIGSQANRPAPLQQVGKSVSKISKDESSRIENMQNKLRKVDADLFSLLLLAKMVNMLRSGISAAMEELKDSYNLVNLATDFIGDRAKKPLMLVVAVLHV